MYFWNIDWTERRLALAKGAVDRALALEPDLPEAHVALAQYYYWGLRAYDQALAELGIARKALPNDPSVVEMSMSIHRRQGKWGEAVAEGEREVAVDPHSPDARRPRSRVPTMTRHGSSSSSACAVGRTLRSSMPSWG